MHMHTLPSVKITEVGYSLIELWSKAICYVRWHTTD